MPTTSPDDEPDRAPDQDSTGTPASKDADKPGSSAKDATDRAPGPPPQRSAWTLAIAAACVLAALFLGRAWGLHDARSDARGSGTAAAPGGDPAAEEIAAGLAASGANEAVAHFRKALEINPTHYGATFQLARALDRAGQREEAARQWERVLRAAEQQNDRPLVDAARARLAQAGGAPVTANGPPGNPGDAMSQGLDALYKKRDPAVAIARFREVLAQNPEHYGATFQLAAAYDLAGDLRSSRPLWERMAQMADAAQDQKSSEAARARMAEIDKALGSPAPGPVDPEAEAMKTAVETLYVKKDIDGAIAQLRGVLKRSPNHYGATFQLATALDLAKKGAEARPLWEKVLKIAEATSDEKTAAAARSRLAQKP